MRKRILFVSQYADQEPIGSNNNVYRQAKALKHDIDVDVEILTWPEQDGWTGPLPPNNKSSQFSYVEWSNQYLNYHIVGLPKKLLDRVLKDSDWQQAVKLGCELLIKINPAIVHLQHWRGLWWILESANRLSIPTVYSAHDWGMGCLRTILVKGEGGLCDGIVNIEKCIECIWRGRNLIGKANELLVSTALGERLIEMLDHSAVDRWLCKYGAVRLGLRKRVTLNQNRAKAIFSNLSALIVPSLLAKDFYQQFGIAENRIHVEPWYYDLTVPTNCERIDRGKIVLGYIGRISPEKGVKRIFDALLSDSIPNPIHLVIAGAIQGDYAEQLHSKFSNTVGKHSVEWMGWLPHHDICKFYEKIDVVIISSEGMDNTPLTLIESFAFERPVIISDMPSIRDLVQEGRTGFLTTFSTGSLEQAIRKVTLNPYELLEMRKNIPPVKSSLAYGSVIKDIYASIEGKGIHL